MTISAVVISHGAKDAVIKMVDALKNTQTKPPDEIILAVCCIDSIDDIPYTDIKLLDRHRDDIGQSKCDFGLRQATMDYVGFFSSDDEYQPTYLEKLSQLDADIVHSQFDSHLAGLVLTPKLSIAQITRGSFLVQRSFALEHGGYDRRDYNADAGFIEKLAKAGATDAVVPEVLYKHN